jgi:uncharacterized 2Fe-2S/4Fe-4S cluster protein (DUF4445 family)
MDSSTIEIRVDDRTIHAEKGVSLLEAMVAAGLLLRSDCGGRGRCGKCLVRVESADAGGLSAPDESERSSLGDALISTGHRLACRAVVYGAVSVEVPAESRLAPEVVQKGLPTLLALPAARVRQPESAWGIAVDVGTTTVAVYLCDLEQRAIAASTSIRNPQAIFGDDVISRIGAVRLDPGSLSRLQSMTVSAIDWAVDALCRKAGIDPHGIGAAVAVGNSTMVHLLLGEDPSSIGVFPYAPGFIEARSVSAGAVGLTFNPGARLRTLPLISGYLGADIVSAALAVDLARRAPGTLLVDVGTNGEIIMLSDAGLSATSCATGPAFEGAAICHGMQATTGAIDATRFNPQTGSLDVTVVQRGDGPPPRPAGICGSGIISTVAELLRAGIITKSGRFNPDGGSACLRSGDSGVAEFEIVPAGASQTGRSITLTQADVRAVQLAKGALRTGIDLLCRDNNLRQPARILLAGAFGSYIDKTAALAIGMFPALPESAIEVVGNAAGAGAILALFDDDYVSQSKTLAQTTRVVDLAAHPDFQNTFIQSLSF